MTVSTNLFATTFFTLTGFHGLHVVVGMLALGIVLGRIVAGDFAGRGESASKGSGLLESVGLYWHFVDVVWLAVFTVVYLMRGAA